MIPPKYLCRVHLLGEHGEIHKHRHNFVKRHSITGRIAGNACAPLSMETRHDELAREMLRRGYNHNSPYTLPDLSHLSEYERTYKVDTQASLLMLLERCPDCNERHKKISKGIKL